MKLDTNYFLTHRLSNKMVLRTALTIRTPTGNSPQVIEEVSGLSLLTSGASKVKWKAPRHTWQRKPYVFFCFMSCHPNKTTKTRAPLHVPRCTRVTARVLLDHVIYRCPYRVIGRTYSLIRGLSRSLARSRTLSREFEGYIRYRIS